MPRKERPQMQVRCRRARPLQTQTPQMQKPRRRVMSSAMHPRMAKACEWKHWPCPAAIHHRCSMRLMRLRQVL